MTPLPFSYKGAVLMTRKEITSGLSVLLERYICPNDDPRIYYAKEVSFNYGAVSPAYTGKKDFINNAETWGRADYMRFKPLNNSISGIEKGDFYCYEIKSCAEDLHSGHGWNFIGDFNYFVMPKEVYEQEKELLHSLYGIGVLIPEEGKLTVVKKAQRKDRKYPASAMLLFMLRSASRELRNV